MSERLPGFGNFPDGYSIPKKTVESSFKINPSHELSQAASHTNQFVVRGKGSGGKTSSLSKGKEIPLPAAPKSGAFNRRVIPPER